MAQQQINQYEGMFLLAPNAAQQQDGGVGLIRGMIERHGGQIIVLKKWDERKLAYEVNKQKRGTYLIAYFRATGGAVTPIERDVKLSEDVMRVLITRADHLNEQEMNAVEPQPIVREERPAWEERGGGGGGYRGGGGGYREDRGPRDDRGPREDRPREDRPREDRPREDRPATTGGGDRGGDRGPRGPRREEAPADAGAAAGAGKD